MNNANRQTLIRFLKKVSSYSLHVFEQLHPLWRGTQRLWGGTVAGAIL